MISQQFEAQFHRNSTSEIYQIGAQLSRLSLSTFSTMLKNLDSAGLLNSIARAKEVGSVALRKIDEFFLRKAWSNFLPAITFEELN